MIKLLWPSTVSYLKFENNENLVDWILNGLSVNYRYSYAELSPSSSSSSRFWIQYSQARSQSHLAFYYEEREDTLEVNLTNNYETGSGSGIYLHRLFIKFHINLSGNGFQCAY